MSATAGATRAAHIPAPEGTAPVTAWIKTPEVTAAISHGTGAAVVTGTVRIAVTGAGTAYVTTGPDTPLALRRGTWQASVHLTRAADGTWQERPDTARNAITRAGLSFDGPPPTYRAAIIAAIIAAVAAAWTPGLDRAAAYAHAAQRLHLDEKERDKAAAALAEIDARIAASLAVLAATAPEGATP